MDVRIPEKMKACILTGPNRFEIRDDVPVPVPGEGEVLCKIGGVAICGSDPGVFDGHLAGEWPPSYPFIAGHEWAGRVVALGPGVTKFKVGIVLPVKHIRDAGIVGCAWKGAIRSV